jgi:serine/threonine protein kinase
MGDLLGRGGMAEVFAGHSVGDHGFQKPVAIKRLLPELANDEVFVDRLIEEAKILVGMQHGNIVSVLDLAREGDDVFLVMEFVDGPSLRQLIKARGSRGLSLGVTTYIVQSSAAGLEFAHARPGGAIIHADISPSNLLLTTSGEVRVADFGIARREGLGEGVVEGKWAYMAPEQARGEALTPRSDVFALGVVLYELLTGEHPFGRAVTANQRDDQMRVIPPRTIRPSLPPGLEAICMRALAHDPRDRYARMQQLIDALVDERFTNGYREGASDLAQAIREVAQGSDVGAPRTMHTERPITLVTRSLLRELTPPPPHTPPRRPSYPAQPLGPHDPPPRDAFPMQPTVGVQTMVRLPEAPPSQEFTAAPGSGAQTTARIVDQVALAQAAAAAAAAMHELPSILRADGTPMPPFRMPDAVRGDELASVVGGHTFTSHGVVAVQNRGQRWTIAVLAAAAMIGVVAGVAIQISPARAADPAPTPHVAPLLPPAADDAEANAALVDPAAIVEPAPHVVETAPPAIEAAPSVIEAAPPAIEAVPPAIEAAPDAQQLAPAHEAAALPSEAAALPTEATPPAPTAAAAIEPAAVPAPAAQAPRRPASSARATERPSTRRVVRDKRKTDPGILSVQAAPWAWVTVGNQKKETPDKFYLAPGAYTVKFYNPENGVTKYEQVVIEAGKLEKLTASMDH